MLFRFGVDLIGLRAVELRGMLGSYQSHRGIGWLLECLERAGPVIPLARDEDLVFVRIYLDCLFASAIYACRASRQGPLRSPTRGTICPRPSNGEGELGSLQTEFAAVAHLFGK